jgi:hypothetical protein
MAARTVRFEIHTYDGNRWMIAAMVEESESQALNRARRMLASQLYEAVKVVCEATSLFGRVSNKEIFHERRPKPANKRGLALAAEAFDAPLETPTDLFNPVIRRALGQSLKNFLTEFTITPTELLYHSGHQQRFRREDTLAGAACHHLGKAWKNAPSELSGMKLIDHLDRLLQGVEEKAKAFSKKPPALLKSPPEIGPQLTHLRQKLPDAEAGDYAWQAMLVHYLADYTSWSAKIDQLLAISACANERGVTEFADNVIAEIIEISDLVKDLLGEQKDLAHALLTLTDIIMQGEAQLGRGAWEGAGELLRRLKKGQLARVKATLTLRLARSLAGDVPLSKQGARKDSESLQQIKAKLLQPDRSLFGGPALEKAFARRWERVRQALLESP